MVEPPNHHQQLLFSTKMSSEEVIGDTSPIFVIIAKGSRCSWTVITSTIAAIEIAESPLIPMGGGGLILEREVIYDGKGVI